MKQKIQQFFLLILFCAISQNLYAQAKLVEKVEKKGSEVVIPYEKYVLPNGLTLIIHEDHSDPVVHVDVTYHVGSAREEIGKSGFAHFFEHMMFQGSDNVADEEHFKIVTESGGTLNGTTNFDRTNYFETLPNNQLEVALWLEADRMGFLLDAVTQQKFEVQRATVKNERGQNYDNRPYGLVFETLFKNMFPYGHPYSWLTIGYVEDLNRVNVNDLKNFFLRWYGPNNAVVTVGGDVNPKEVVTLVEKYFGPINRGPEVKNMSLPAPVIEKDRYVSLEDNYIKLPMLVYSLPGVPRYHKDEAALDCLMEILGQGKNSLMYKNLDKAQKAVQSAASHNSFELAGALVFNVIPFPGLMPAEMEKIIRATLQEFEARGVTDEDITRFKAQYESQTVNDLNSVSRKVSLLAAYQTFAGNPNYIGKELNEYLKVTKEDVMRVYNQYVKGKAAVILTVYPKGAPQLKAGEDNYTVSTEGYTSPNYGYDGLTYNKAKDSFDRKLRPASGKNPVVSVPDYWTSTLKNGLKMIGMQSTETPTVTLYFSLKGGHLLSEKEPQKAGIATLTMAMMNEATEKYTTEEINNELQKLGSSISFSAGAEEINISVSTLTKNLDATLAILEEKMFKPRFSQEDFDRLKKRQLENIKQQDTQPAFVANKLYAQMLYGDNIRAVPISGTEATVQSITLNDVKNFYQSYFSSIAANLVVVGDLPQNAIAPKLAFLEKWEAKKYELPKAVDPKKIEKTQLFVIDQPKAAQSEIRIGYVTSTPYDATGDFYKSTIMNYVLGGAFNSRINLNLREDKGFTYGARSSFSATDLGGTFTAAAGVKASATDSSVVEFMKELNNYANNGITEAELTFTKNSIGQRDALNYETPFQKAAFLSRIVKYNLSKDYVKKQMDILNKMTKADIDALAKKYITTGNMHILVIGDKSLILPGLKKLEYNIIELDKDGKVVDSENKTGGK